MIPKQLNDASFAENPETKSDELQKNAPEPKQPERSKPTWQAEDRITTLGSVDRNPLNIFCVVVFGHPTKIRLQRALFQ